MVAVLGVLAYRTLKGKGRLADLLGTGTAATAGSPTSNGPSGAELSGGLADLLARFRQAKQEKTAQSWVSTGPNRSIAPHELEQRWEKSAFSGSSSKLERQKMNSWWA
jgi:uncharacterized protein YidB (DUF937 family)